MLLIRFDEESSCLPSSWLTKACCRKRCFHSLFLFHPRQRLFFCGFQFMLENYIQNIMFFCALMFWQLKADSLFVYRKSICRHNKSETLFSGLREGSSPQGFGIKFQLNIINFIQFNEWKARLPIYVGGWTRRNKIIIVTFNFNHYHATTYTEHLDRLLWEYIHNKSSLCAFMKFLGSNPQCATKITSE